GNIEGRSHPHHSVSVRDHDGRPGGIPGPRSAGLAPGTGNRLAPAITTWQPGEPLGQARVFQPGEPGASTRGHDAARFVSDRSGRRSVVLFASDPGADDRRASGSVFARFSLAGLVRGNALACRNRPGGDARGLLASAAGRTITRWTS